MQGFDMMLKMAGIDPAQLEAKAKGVFEQVRAEVQAEFSRVRADLAAARSEVAALHDRFTALEFRLSEAAKPAAHEAPAPVPVPVPEALPELPHVPEAKEDAGQDHAGQQS